MTKIIEIWKSVVGYEGLYEVSSFDRVRSYQARWKRLRILKPYVSRYVSYMLTKNGKHDNLLLHRIKMMAFNPIEDYNSMQVNHIDGNKLNNHLSNLEWCTPKENSQHSIRIGLKKGKRGSDLWFSKLSEYDIPFIRSLVKGGVKQPVVSKMYGVCRSTISGITTNRRWKHVLMFLVICSILSCSPNRLLKRAERLTNKAIQKGAVIANDTVYVDRTYIIPEHHTDTLIQVKTFRDTIHLENERIKWKIKVNEKTIFVDAKCKADTVIIRIPVEVTRTVKPNRNTFAIIVWSALGGMLLLAIGFLVFRDKKIIIKQEE
jgi:hypothetical protein